MKDTFKSVKHSVIATAFACAHQYAREAKNQQDARRFRHIARLIWDSCGEQGQIPKVLPVDIETLGTIERQSEAMR